MKWMLAGAACAVVALAAAGAAEASPCASACDRDYTQCNGQNSANAQQVCMPKWMQCKKACTGAVKTAAHVSSAPTPPKR